MKRLFLHIGMPKTGTTAVQTYLGEHYDALLRLGILYPRLGCEHPIFHHIFARPFKVPSPHDGIWSLAPTDRLTSKQEILTALANEVEATQADTIIISSEVFYCLSAGIYFDHHAHIDVASDVAAFFDGYDVEVVAYFRRQDEWLESCYIEAVKGPHTLLARKIEEFDVFTDRDKLDYGKQIAPWEAAFGHDNVRVRSFDEARDGAGVINSFLSDVGLPDGVVGSESKASEYVDNVSPPKPAVELIRLLNGMHAKARDAHPRLLPPIDELRKAFKDAERVYFLTDEQRQSLLVSLQTSNEAFAERYGLNRFRELSLIPDAPTPWLYAQPLDQPSMIALIDLIHRDRVKLRIARDKLLATADERLAANNRLAKECSDLSEKAETRLASIKLLSAERDRSMKTAEQQLAEVKRLRRQRNDLFEAAERQITEVNRLSAERSERLERAEAEVNRLSSERDRLVRRADEHRSQIVSLKSEKEALNKALQKWQQKPIASWLSNVFRQT